MQKSNVTNNHFRGIFNVISEFMQRNEEVPEDLIMVFVNELKYSNLLISGKIEEGDLVFDSLASPDDESSALPLYADDEEYIKGNGLN